ncbi:MAG: HepT-like ribonuclease domain-containing protein [Roseiarcus sp.]
MAKRLLSLRLEDIIEAIERLRATLNGVAIEAFELDWEKRWLVERGIEIISEASRHLDDDMKARRPEVPWPKVAGIGNILRHAYDHVAADVLWKVVHNDLSSLDRVCREELVAALARERKG